MTSCIPSRRLVVLCPAFAQTGGPEALHQLVDACRKQGYDARIAYYPVAAPVVYAYTHYRFPILPMDEIHSGDHLVIPETEAHTFFENNTWSLPFQKYIWWLSWDNFRVDIQDLKKIPHLKHLAQSIYAKNKLDSCKLQPSSLLGDYLKDIFLRDRSCKASRKDIVLYNPAKGFYWTQKLMQLLPDIEWVALKGISPKNVLQLMQKAKVYVDFGHAPGLDRFPREALMSGLAVITSRTGAFGIKEDWNLPETFKFNLPKVINQPTSVGFERNLAVEEELELKKVADLILTLFKNHEQAITQYSKTVEQIRDQKKHFFEQARLLCENAQVDRLSPINSLKDKLRIPFRRLYGAVHPLTLSQKLKKLEKNIRCFFRGKSGFSTFS